MLILLGKQHLGQSEKHELSGPAGEPINQEHTLNDRTFAHPYKTEQM